MFDRMTPRSARPPAVPPVRPSLALVLAGIVLAGLGLSSAPDEGAGRPMSVDDGLDVATFDEACLSPRGDTVVYSRSDLDWAGNGRRVTWWRSPAARGEPAALPADSGGSAFAFSPDGRSLAFLRPVDGRAQVHVRPAGGGEAVRLTRHETAVRSFLWAPDSSRIVFLADDARSRPGDPIDAEGSGAIFVDEGPNGREAGRWSNLWSVDVAARREARLTDEAWLVSAFDLSPDGRRAVAAARRENRRNSPNLSELYEVPLDGGRPVRLTDNEAPEAKPRWSPDGRTVAFLAADDRGWELRQPKVWLLDRASRGVRLASGAFEGEVEDFAWGPGPGALVFAGRRRTAVNLYRLDAATGTVVPLSFFSGTVTLLGLSADRGRVVYAFSDARTPPELYTASTAAFVPVRLTSENEGFFRGRIAADVRTVRWAGPDGLEIEGLLYLPPGAADGPPPPLVVNVHGGPAGGFLDRFHPVYHLYAGLGFASLCPNVRGSSGYGDAFLRANMGDLCGRDADDLLSGVDAVARRGLADPGRVALRGWSYGGILGAWTLTRTDRFRAASLGGLVSDWASEYGTGFNYDVRLWYIGGTPWENPEGWRGRSVLARAERVRTPVILFHGADDATDTEGQSMNLFAYLRDMGKTVRYVRFPREAHALSRPRSQRLRDVEEIRWFERYVLGRDWEPMSRPGT